MTAVATRRRPATRKRSAEEDVLNTEAEPRTIQLPNRCKPSLVCSVDPTLPILAVAKLEKRQGHLWLFVTDSYCGVAIKVQGNAEEGLIPLAALKAIEQGGKKPPVVVQASETAWTVTTTDKFGVEAVTVYDCSTMVGKARYPNMADLIPWDAPDQADLSAEPFGFNPRLLAKIGAAFGDAPLKVETTGPLRPIRLTSSGVDAVGLQMPVRVNNLMNPRLSATNVVRRFERVEVTRVTAAEGLGEPDNPVRRVVYWYDQNGALIARHDPHETAMRAFDERMELREVADAGF